MKSSIAITALLIVLISCKKTEVVQMDLKCPITARKGDDTKITGKWKLVKSETTFTSRTSEDYSCNEVIYDFRSDGSLIVTSDVDKYLDGTTTNYQYKFTKSKQYDALNQPHVLQIDQRSVACKISDGVMILDDSPLDGPIMHFVRL